MGTETKIMSDVVLFRAGNYGPKGNYTVDDIAKIAACYDPKWLEAPVTPDHLQEGPAWGWVIRVFQVGDELHGDLAMDPEAYNLIKRGAYKRRSVEIYNAFSLRNGEVACYIKAVSFLGAMTPAVKGMENYRFNAENRYTEFTIEEVQTMSIEAGANASAFAEEKQTLLSENARLAGELEKQKADKQALKVQFAEMAAEISAMKNERDEERAFSAFSATLSDALHGGRITPRQQDYLAAIFKALPADTAAGMVAFKDDAGADVSLTPRALLGQYLSNTPKIVPIGEKMQSAPAPEKRTFTSGDLKTEEFRNALAELASQIEESEQLNYADALAVAELRLLGKVEREK